MHKTTPVWWHSRTRWAATQGVIGGRFWKPGCKGFDGLLFEETHPAEPLYDQKTVDHLTDKLRERQEECDRLQLEIGRHENLIVQKCNQLTAAVAELEVCSTPTSHGNGPIPCGKCGWCMVTKALNPSTKPTEGKPYPCPAIKRMWVNQPSELHPYHDLHGTNVLAVQDCYETYRVYFLDGHVISSQIDRTALCPGWKESTKREIR